MCIIAKLYNRMILSRIQMVLDPKLRSNQNGFRPNRTTATQILALRCIIGESRKNNLSAVLTFIDCQKEFDSINWNKMMKILKAFDIPPNLLRAVEGMYTDTRVVVVTPDGETEDLAEVLQGRHTGPLPFHHSTGLYAVKSDRRNGQRPWPYHHTMKIQKNTTSHLNRSRLCWWHMLAE